MKLRSFDVTMNRNFGNFDFYRSKIPVLNVDELDLYCLYAKPWSRTFNTPETVGIKPNNEPSSVSPAKEYQTASQKRERRPLKQRGKRRQERAEKRQEKQKQNVPPNVWAASHIQVAYRFKADVNFETEGFPPFTLQNLEVELIKDCAASLQDPLD